MPIQILTLTARPSLVAATGDTLTGLVNDFANFLQGLGVPGGQIAFTLVGLLALAGVASGGVNARKVAGAMLGVLLVVAFIAAGGGAVREADDVGTEIGDSLDGGE